MCGIVGYIGHRNATPILVDGLRRLEYRGYDSAGLAVLNEDGLHVRRRPGKIAGLESLLARAPVAGTIGLGHTRWATHGRPSEANAHPHVDCTNALAVIHNGILANYASLKARLIAAGHQFRSETDTEVIAHLVESHRRPGRGLADAVRAALDEIEGAYAVGIIDASTPDLLVVARRGAGAVIVGLGEGETFVASDIPAILPHSRQVVVLEDDEVGLVTRAGLQLTTRQGRPMERAPVSIGWNPEMAQKGGYPHFMLKEIHEQSRAVTETFLARLTAEQEGVSLPEANLTPAQVAGLRRVVFVACGTSYHAALIGRFMIERMAGLPAEVDIASEFRYRDLVLGPDVLVVAVSQSGETADTLGAARAARGAHAAVLAITNVVGSALVREASGVLYTHAGPEIGVASTKTFTATITACYLLALALGRERGVLDEAECRKRIEELLEMPRLIDAALDLAAPLRDLARELAASASFLFIGRGVQHAVALEGALKLKELSYVHAEGYPAGELKHGPIALIEATMPVVALAPSDGTYDRMIANIEEVKARGGRAVAVCHAGDVDLPGRVDHVVAVPASADLLAPLVTVIPLQLLAYHIAVARGCDVDQPRNLAKSVTVE